MVAIRITHMLTSLIFVTATSSSRAKSCSPFEQPLCSLEGLGADGLLSQASASWCNLSNPFVLQRTLASDSLATGPLSSVPEHVAMHACDPLAPGADPALDGCTAVGGLASAELSSPCSALRS